MPHAKTGTAVIFPPYMPAPRVANGSDWLEPVAMFVVGVAVGLWSIVAVFG